MRITHRIEHGFMRPFRCPVTILNTIDHLGKFDGKADEGFFVGYSINSKAFRVLNSRTRIVEENMHVHFSENTPNIARSTKACDDAGDDEKKRADMNNLDAFMPVSPILTTRVHKDHPIEQIIGDLNSTPQIRRVTKNLEEHDDIIFGSTEKSLCIEFEKMMHKKFQISFLGKLTFFLGQQVKQKDDGIFISQDKYVTEILTKFGFTNVKTASTPMETQNLLLKDEDGKEVDVHLYRSMIGSLMYLTSSRPDVMFAVSYTDSDYTRASLDSKFTAGGCQFLGCRLISWQCKKQTVVANSTTEAEYVAALDKNVADLLTKAFDATIKVKTVNGEVQLQALVDGKKIIVTEASMRLSTE
ncbi:uncharacterized mitochondrial protein-like protein [Tanacetum coccineum]